MRNHWLRCRYLAGFTGHVVVDGRPWGYCRVRIDYRRGGFTIATVPLWLAGFLSMESRGKQWHRHWQRGQDEEWIKVEERKSAAEIRAESLASEGLSGFALLQALESSLSHPTPPHITETPP